MRALITGVSGLVGSNLAIAAVQRGWEVMGTWNSTPVEVRGARTARLEMGDRAACVDLSTGFEADVIIHAAASVELSRIEHEPELEEGNLRGAENTLAAAAEAGARYVLVSSDWVFSGDLEPGRCWHEEDARAPANAYGRSKLACEQAVQRADREGWLITRPANVYGVNRSEVADGEAQSHHVWANSSLALRWVEHLREGRPLAAPAAVYQAPTYARDYAERVCDLVEGGSEGVFNTAGPEAMHRLDYLRLLADVFDCDPELIREGSLTDFLRDGGEAPDLVLPANTALCDGRSNLELGRSAVGAVAGHRLMREELSSVLKDDSNKEENRR